MVSPGAADLPPDPKLKEVNTDRHTQELTPELFDGVETVRTWSAVTGYLRDKKPGARVIIEAISDKLSGITLREDDGTLSADRIVLAMSAKFRLNVRAIILYEPGPRDKQDYRFGIMKDAVN